MDKAQLRLLIRDRFNEVDTSRFMAWSAAIDNAIVQRVCRLGKDSCTILLYWSLNDEVPTHSVIDQLCALGHTVLLPRVVGEQLHLVVYQGQDSLMEGAFGIMEPFGMAWDDPDKIDIAFIPGRAFTRNGSRLGRGKAYYDRLLPLLNCPTVGVCFPFQIVESINTEPHDIPCSELLEY